MSQETHQIKRNMGGLSLAAILAKLVSRFFQRGSSSNRNDLVRDDAKSFSGTTDILAPEGAHDEPFNDDLAEIDINNKHIREITSEALQALISKNTPPTTYVRSGALVIIRVDEKNYPMIEEMSESTLRGRLDRSADYVRITKKKDETITKPVNPPMEVVKDILTLGEWKFPPLEGIIECPNLRPDGTVIFDEGYDIPTHLYHHLAKDLRITPIPECPSRQDTIEAVNLLTEVIADFPFVDTSSTANALGLMLTPFVRPAIKGKVPLAIIDAPQAGTGKTLLASTVALIATGHDHAIMTMPKNEEEVRKKITSSLMIGTRIITIDNLSGPLSSGELASVLSAPEWSDRILGRSQMTRLPQWATWMATGNNVTLGGDIPRRCYWIKLDAKKSQPWDRNEFCHPDLAGWVKENRGALIWAALTIARSWFVAGCPQSNSRIIGGFSDWSKVIGGILAYAGVDGFLGNLDTMYKQTDDDSQEWEVFLVKLNNHFDGKSFKVSDVCEMFIKNILLREYIPGSLWRNIKDDDVDSGSFRQSLGISFKKHSERRYGNSQIYIIKDSNDNNHGVARWRIHQGE